MKCFPVFFVFTLYWTFILSESCITPLSVNSQCIKIYECPSLLAAFNQGQLTSRIITFLKASQCGFDGYVPKVCCGPLPEISQNANTQRPSTTWPSTNTEVQSSQGQDPVSREDSSPAPSSQCGLDEHDRIYGGQITDLDEFPWMALLGYLTRNKTYTYQCGGVLINKRYVLTAAHCVIGQVERDVGKLASVRLGEYDTQQEVDCLDGVCADRPQEIPVQAVFPHSGFSEKNINRKDDVALVRLSRRAKYTFYVRPICLGNNNDARLDAGHTVYVAGWGKTLNGKNSPVKLKLAMPVFDKSECVNKYRPVGAELTSYQICAGGAFAQDTCRGDSGGPLMRRRSEGFWEAVGIVSFGNGCGKDGWPGVYTSVASYSDWIRSTLRSTNL